MTKNKGGKYFHGMEPFLDSQTYHFGPSSYVGIARLDSQWAVDVTTFN